MELIINRRGGVFGFLIGGVLTFQVSLCAASSLRELHSTPLSDPGLQNSSSLLEIVEAYDRLLEVFLAEMPESQALVLLKKLVDSKAPFVVSECSNVAVTTLKLSLYKLERYISKNLSESDHSLLEHALETQLVKRICEYEVESRIREKAMIQSEPSNLEARKILQHADSVHSTVFSPDGRSLATATWAVNSESKFPAQIWDALTGRVKASLLGHTGWVGTLRFSSDGKYLVTSSCDQTGAVWESDSGALVLLLKGYSDTVKNVEISADGKFILVVSTEDEGVVRILSFPQGIVLFEWRGYLFKTLDFATLSPDGRYFLMRYSDGSFFVGNVSTGQEIYTRKIDIFNHGRVNSNFKPQFSTDGSHLAMALNERELGIFENPLGQQVQTLVGHSQLIFSLNFSRDGKTAVTASADGTARIWDLATGDEKMILEGHSAKVVQAVFSPDGRWVATASEDATGRVWEANSGREIAVLRGHQSALISIHFSPDGRSLVTGSYDKTARIWDLGSLR